jgi:hypothetical protein
LPADPRWQGRSLLGGADAETRRAYFSNYQSTMLGLREGKYKFIREVDRKRDRLFDLEQDPEERQDIGAQYPDLCESLRRRLQLWVRYQSHLTQEYLRQRPQ